MANNDAVKRLNNYLDMQLKLHHPDRAEVNDPVYAEIAASVPADMIDGMVRKVLVRDRLTTRIEASKRNAKKILSDFAETGQLALDWWETAHYLLPVTTYIEDPDTGEMQKRNERVRIGAATPDDFRAYAEEERKALAKDVEARNRNIDGATQLANEISGAGVVNYGDLGMTVAPPEATA